MDKWLKEYIIERAKYFIEMTKAIESTTIDGSWTNNGPYGDPRQIFDDVTYCHDDPECLCKESGYIATFEDEKVAEAVTYLPWIRDFLKEIVNKLEEENDDEEPKP